MRRLPRTEKWRWRIAYRLNRLPWLCWSDLVEWAMQGESTHRLMRRTLRDSGSARCRIEAREHRDRSCYCGKFRQEVSE